MNYREIVEQVLNNGEIKVATRDGKIVNKTLTRYCLKFSHDMGYGYPLTTLRKMPFKSMCVELEGFIQGITSKKWYQDRGCRFWDQWANPTKGGNQLQEDDLGPIYGYQWRKFGQKYHEKDDSGVEKGFDQLYNIVNKLKNSPEDRRMVCSAWNPNQLHMMALPPCHYSWSVESHGGVLNLSWNQRSCDLIRGVCNNIASYGLLLLLLCKECNLRPGYLFGKLEDCHIYFDQIEAATEIVERKERNLPSIELKDGVSIFDWTHKDVFLEDYYPNMTPINLGGLTV